MSLRNLSDEALVESFKAGVLKEREEQVLFLLRLGEVSRRELWKKSHTNRLISFVATSRELRRHGVETHSSLSFK